MLTPQIYMPTDASSSPFTRSYSHTTEKTHCILHRDAQSIYELVCPVEMLQTGIMHLTTMHLHMHGSNQSTTNMHVVIFSFDLCSAAVCARTGMPKRLQPHVMVATRCHGQPCSSCPDSPAVKRKCHTVARFHVRCAM